MAKNNFIGNFVGNNARIGRCVTIIDGIEVIETPTRVKFMLSKEAKEIQSEKAGE